MDRVEPLIDSAAQGASGRERPLAHADFLTLAAGLLRETGSLHFQARGRSMQPFIRAGDDVLIRAASGRRLARGDVVLFDAGGGSARLHRLVRRVPDGRWIARGDGLWHADPPVAPEAILGIAVWSERGGRRRALDRGVVWLAGQAWLLMHPARHAAARIVRFLRNR